MICDVPAATGGTCHVIGSGDGAVPSTIENSESLQSDAVYALPFQLPMKIDPFAVGLSGTVHENDEAEGDRPPEICEVPESSAKNT